MLKAKPIGHSTHSFEMYPATQISRSVFNRSNSLITTMNSGYLVPIWSDVAYPGDTLICETNAFARLATQIVPFMDNVYMDIHFWCVPNRLIWEHWVNFQGEQPQKFDPSDPLDGTDYLTPQLTTDSTTSEATEQTIFDYFNIPINVPNLSFNAFNFRAYNLVWNEWYRDENLQDPVIVPTGDTDSMSNYTLLKRGKRKDYFTSCLPVPQKGPAVDLPLGLTAPVVGNGTSLGLLAYSAQNSALKGMTLRANSGGALYTAQDGFGQPIATTVNNASDAVSQKTIGVTTDADKSGLIVDLTNATASTINSLRQAFAIQRMFETDARGGTRYIEMILAHFGVKSPDARLQRPEFLGGATFNLNMNVVPQTSATGTTPQANLSSYGVINGSSSRIVHSFTEHCTVFAVASIRADLTYQQGLPREYSYRLRTDYYLPSYANLGEQAVKNKEIFAQGGNIYESDNVTVVDDEVFGYQERWAEMRYKPSRITGYTRSQASTSLDFWHLAQEFQNLPTLNSTFIEENPPLSRVIAVTGANTPEFIANFYFKEKWVRPLPVYSIPSMSAHF